MLFLMGWVVVILNVLSLSYCAKRELFDHDVAFLEKPITHSLTTQLRLHERGVGPGDFRIHGTYTLPSGITKLKLAQTFKGVSVFGAFIVGEHKNGKHGGRVSGHIIKGIHQDLKGNISPKLSAKEAISACLQTLDGKGHVAHENADFIVYAGFNYEHNVTATLAYYVTMSVETSSGVVEPSCLIDAMTGGIIKKWDAIASAVQNVNSVGGNGHTGQYLYAPGGSVPANPNFPPLQAQVKDATTCELVTGFVEVYNLKTGVSPRSVKEPWSFPCSSGFRDPRNGAFSPLSDTFFYSHATYHLYMKHLGVPPLPLPKKIKLYAHYGSIGTIKAQYSNIDKRVLLGTGNTRVYYPFATVGIIAHELGHAFTYSYSKIVKQDEGYGLHEGFSDISAAMVKYELKQQRSFLFGDEIQKDPNGFDRDMCNPTRDGKSIDNYKNYVTNMDGHQSCGIINKAFCTLVTHYRWDIRTAFKVFAIANMKYWTETTGFNHAVCGIEQAARDLRMSDSDVRGAFAVVGCACPKSGNCENSVYGCKYKVF